eukprot:scaffold2681_cov13-Prasinocladus_malaysianus.AAC.1
MKDPSSLSKRLDKDQCMYLIVKHSRLSQKTSSKDLREPTRLTNADCAGFTHLSGGGCCVGGVRKVVYVPVRPSGRLGKLRHRGSPDQILRCQKPRARYAITFSGG